MGIFRLFTFDREAANYSTNIEYARSGQYLNVVEFELCHIPSDGIVVLMLLLMLMMMMMMVVV